MDPRLLVHGTLQARILEGVVVPSSRGSSQPRIEPASLMSTFIGRRFFTTNTTWEVHHSLARAISQGCNLQGMNPVKASIETSKILVGRFRDLPVLRLPKTSLMHKFPCLLEPPPTNL